MDWNVHDVCDDDSLYLAITEISYKKGINLEQDCIKLHHSEQMHQYNHSLCDFIKQFKIYQIPIMLQYVSIRTKSSLIFVNGKETIKGVQINTRH